MTRINLYLIVLLLYLITCAHTNTFASTLDTTQMESIDTLTISTDSITIETQFKTFINQAISPVVVKENDMQKVTSCELDGWNNWLSSLISIFSIVALAISLLGILSLKHDAKRRKNSKRCQRQAVLDLIRHMFINLMILEGVKEKMKENKRPESGTFLRFTALESDLEFSRFYINSFNFEHVHQLSLSIRNYNIHCKLLEEHFKDAKDININEELNNDVVNLEERIRKCIYNLWSIQKIILQRRWFILWDLYSFRPCWFVSPLVVNWNVIKGEELIKYIIDKHKFQKLQIDKGTGRPCALTDADKDRFKDIKIPFINDLTQEDMDNYGLNNFWDDNSVKELQQEYIDTYRSYCAWRMTQDMKFYDNKL